MSIRLHRSRKAAHLPVTPAVAMGRKRKKAAAEGDEQPKPAKQARQSGEAQQHDHVVPVVRLVALDNANSRVAVAVGSSLRVLNYSTGEVQHQDEQHTTAPLRALCFSPNGSLLLAAGDDHKARLLDTSRWKCIRTIKAPKKISAAAFTQDGVHAILADKFGDAVIAPTATAQHSSDPSPADGHTEVPGLLLLGHMSTIVTSLSVSPDNSFVVTTDKDAKVRVSVLPQNPQKGSWEIQSYCFGHTSYVTCSLALLAPDSEQTLVLSGGGDGTVRLWNPQEGRLLYTYVAAQPRTIDNGAPSQEQPADTANGKGSPDADSTAQSEQQQPEQQEQQQQEQQQEEQHEVQEEQDMDAEQQEPENEPQGGEDGPLDCAVRQQHDCAAVLSIAAAPDRRTLAVVVEGELEVQLLQLSHANGIYSLICSQRLALEGLQAPCNVQFDGQGRLWVVGGPPVLQSSSAHVGVARPVAAGESSRQGTAAPSAAASASAAAGSVDAATAAATPANGAGTSSSGSRTMYMDCTAQVLTTAGRAALEQRNDEEEQAAAAGAGAAGTPVLCYSELTVQLKKRGPPDQAHEGKERRHHKETQRLSKLAEQHAEQQQQQQQQQQQREEEQLQK